MLTKRKIESIFLISFLALFLTACQADLDELQEKTKAVREQKETASEEVEETVGESADWQKDPQDMSLDEIEEELNDMEDLEIDEDLDNIEEEL
jgi:cell division protein FtsB